MIPTLEAFKYIHADTESCTYEPQPKYLLTILLQVQLEKEHSSLPVLGAAAKKGTMGMAGVKH